ncbi:MAG: Altronate dehydratase, partial [Bacteroidota bacterium]
MQKKLIKVDPTDNVAVALVNLVAGETIAYDGEDVLVVSDTKMKHKIAMKDFQSGDKIIMYGVIVGKASQTIAKGDTITTANVKHESAKVTGKTDTIGWEVPNVDQWKDKTFMGYHRTDGQVGTENVWLFFPLVFCENRNIEILKGIFEKELKKPKENDYQLLLRSLVNSETGADDAVTKSAEVDLFENIDVKFIQHQGGCGGIRQDSHSLAKLLAGYVNNPNVAGATVLSLG